MLRHELGWLDQHAEVLELCGVRPERLQLAGGECHLHQMLEKTAQHEQLLPAEIAKRGLSPDPHRQSVVADEHAWEPSHPAIRHSSQFGMVTNSSATEGCSAMVRSKSALVAPIPMAMAAI